MREPSGGFRHIAVLRLSSLGDVILTLPVVEALRRTYPQARLTYWTKEEFREVVGGDPNVTHVRSLERDARRFEDLLAMSSELEECDLIVDLHGSVRTRVLTFRQRAQVLRPPSHRWQRARWVHARWSAPRPAPHVLERYAAALAPLAIPVDGVPRVHAGAEADAWATTWLGSWAASAPIALCPGARHATKRWPEHHWVALHERLIGAGHDLLYLSLAHERDAVAALASRVAAEPRARWCTESLPRMSALLARAAGAVVCDSGLMHLAAACGIKVVALFGSTAPELGFAPAGAGHAVLCRREPCQPCTLHGRARCPRGHFRCMEALHADEVGPRLEALVSLSR